MSTLRVIEGLRRISKYFKGNRAKWISLYIYIYRLIEIREFVSNKVDIIL